MNTIQKELNKEAPKMFEEGTQVFIPEEEADDIAAQTLDSESLEGLRNQLSSMIAGRVGTITHSVHTHGNVHVNDDLPELFAYGAQLKKV
jgi:hypothetical protein